MDLLSERRRARRLKQWLWGGSSPPWLQEKQKRDGGSVVRGSRVCARGKAAQRKLPRSGHTRSGKGLPWRIPLEGNQGGINFRWNLLARRRKRLRRERKYRERAGCREMRRARWADWVQLPMKGRKEEARYCGLTDEHRRAQGRTEPQRQYEDESISDLIIHSSATS